MVKKNGYSADDAIRDLKDKYGITLSEEEQELVKSLKLGSSVQMIKNNSLFKVHKFLNKYPNSETIEYHIEDTFLTPINVGTLS